MAATKTPQALTTGGHAWGAMRVRLGVSLRNLSALTGIPRGYLSMAERGRLVPTGDEYADVMAALTKTCDACRSGNHIACTALEGDCTNICHPIRRSAA